MSKYEKQFEFAKKMWETSNNKKYSGSKKEKLEIEKDVKLIKQIMEVKNKPNFKFKSNNALIGQSNLSKFHDAKYEELLMIPFLFNFLKKLCV